MQLPNREELEVMLRVAMRVPGLFIIDYWWLYERNKALPKTLSNTDVMHALVTNVLLIHGFLLLLLPIDQLRLLYSHLLSGILLLLSHFISEHYISIEMNSEHLLDDHSILNPRTRHIVALVCHFGIAAAVFSFLEGPSRPLQAVLSAHTLPVFARLADFPLETLPPLQKFGDALLCVSTFYYSCYKLPCLLDRIKETYTETVALTHRFEMKRVLTLIWSKLFVPTHFLVFWLLTFCGKLVEVYDDSDYSPKPYLFALQCASAICCSPVTLLATSVVVSYLACLTIKGSRLFLGATVDDNPMHSGWTQGLTMLVLGMQTGLMEISLPGRTSALLVILFVVMSSLLQSILEITEPVVLGLSASRSTNMLKHARALTMCLILFILPLMLTIKLAQIFPIDFWMMMVLSACVLTSVQVLGILIVHGLFVYDGLREADRDQDLDEVVYYAKAFTKVLEFLVALVVVAAGVYESTVGKWNIANATILLLHCYCNVYQRMKAGWRSFLLRHEASQKTESLATPTPDQLVEYNDVCPICYQQLQTGGATCVTLCNHFFHRNCLKKWLYSQDNCPMCHSRIITTSVAESDDINVDPALNVIQALEQEAQ